jgi:protease II
VTAGVYTIQQASNGRYVDAYESDGQDFRLVTREAQDNDSQRWVLLPSAAGSFTIQQLVNARFVDAHEDSAHDFSVVTRPAQNNDSQRWILG